jgi:CheY-like chemotaxis protein
MELCWAEMDSQNKDARRVLVVDDNADSADSLSAVLELFGHQVETAYDGPGALEIARRLQPEVMVIDLGMPGLSGLEVAARVRAEEWGANTLLLALTGRTQAADREKTRQAGFDRHLIKPVDFTELEQIVAEAPARDR